MGTGWGRTDVGVDVVERLGDHRVGVAHCGAGQRQGRRSLEVSGGVEQGGSEGVGVGSIGGVG